MICLVFFYSKEFAESLGISVFLVFYMLYVFGAVSILFSDLSMEVVFYL